MEQKCSVSGRTETKSLSNIAWIFMSSKKAMKQLLASQLQSKKVQVRRKAKKRKKKLMQSQWLQNQKKPKQKILKYLPVRRRVKKGKKNESFMSSN